MGTIFQNIRYGFRLLLKQPGFSMLAVTVLALGIGANSAMFSMVNAFLFKPLLVKNAQQLIGVYHKDSKHPDSYRAFSYGEYSELRANNSAFSSVMAHNMAMVGISEGDTTRRAFADLVSSNYFDFFGVPLYRGRPFTADEERPGSATQVAILSHSYWRKSGSDPDILGKTVRVNGKPYSVVGVAADGFTGTTALISVEMYLPLGVYESTINDFDNQRMPLADPKNYNLILVGRLKPDITAQSANARLSATPVGIDKDYAMTVSPLSRLSITTNPSSDDDLRVPAILMLFMSGIVLLIASLNVANMMLARGASRRKEIAVRLALGADRGNVIGQLFSEGLLLAVIGGAVGLLVSYWSTKLLVGSMSRLLPIDIVFSAAPDPRVLAATMGFCLLSTVLFSLAPAWNLSRPNLSLDLKTGEHDNTDGGKVRRVWSRRNLLVIGQLALSLMLLCTAGLFIRNSLSVAQSDMGFRKERHMLVELDPSLAGYDQKHGEQVYRTLLGRMRALPGVESASLSATVPFGMTSFDRGVQRASDSAAAGKQVETVGCAYGVTTTDYFRTMGIPLLRGRDFSEAEASDPKASPVAILSKAAADRLFSKTDALGQRIRIMAGGGNSGSVVAEVIGVVGNLREHMFGNGRFDYVYVPVGQNYQANMTFHLKSASDSPESAARLAEAIRREIRDVDSAVPVLNLRTMRENMDNSFDFWILRTAARMFTTFGVVALVLAAVGLYGVRAYMVTRRTREIGIRMAIGASTGDTLRLVLGEGMIITAAGSVIGLALSLALGRVIAGMLFHVSAADPTVLVTAPLLLGVVSLAACYFPARRASRVNPMVALRQE